MSLNLEHVTLHVLRGWYDLIVHGEKSRAYSLFYFTSKTAVVKEELNYERRYAENVSVL